MNKNILIIFVLVVVSLLFFVIKPVFTGEVISKEKMRLGYCPTMQEEAISLSQKKDYELVKLSSASEVLYALNNNQVDKGLIGRKAKLNEINSNIKETTLKSGYTLVSKNKGFIESSQLPFLDIYTYLEEDFNFPVNKISKEEVLGNIDAGKIALISWKDWNDNFELIVVMNGNEKVKDFRGVFLYEN